MFNTQYTHEDLAEMKRNLKERISDVLDEYPEARPLPPMEEMEACDFLSLLIETTAIRPLVRDECFLMGQLLSCYRQAIEARMLGRKGRYFVVSEADIERLTASRNLF